MRWFSQVVSDWSLGRILEKKQRKVRRRLEEAQAMGG